MKTALISVSDKTGVVELAKGLLELGFRILSTGGTAEALRKDGVPVVEVSDYTGWPEMMDGRIKTLHPKVFGGILNRPGTDDSVMTEFGLWPIRLVVVNLYPFQKKVAEGASHEEIIDNIDIGGPSMLRAAAKNHQFVTVVVDPIDYDEVLRELAESATGLATKALREKLALKVFRHSRSYEDAITQYMGNWLDPS